MRPNGRLFFLGRDLFQFTHPRGVRRILYSMLNKVAGFQFTHPRGVRQVADRVREQWLEFQFTHPRGVRHHVRGDPDRWLGFQFTHPRGVRPEPVLEQATLFEFQFTHPRGVRPLSRRFACTASWFQFTHPRGVRPAKDASPPPRLGFNSRTREGCDCRDGEVAVELPLQTCFCEGTQIIPSVRCFWHLKSYNRMSMSACECLANS